MKIEELIVTQDGFRNLPALERMTKFVKNGGKFCKKSITDYAKNDNVPLIGITQFEDGKLAIHDGHHRIASIFLSKTRSFLHDEEYFIRSMTYDYYNEIGFAEGWVTPFHPLYEVRLPNFGSFKKEALDLYKEDENKAIQFILNNKHRYLLPRQKRHDSIVGIIDCFFKKVA